MSAVIIKQGLLDTIQDFGRYGYQHAGINPNGAMDLVAASIANLLVGNLPTEAVIELHFPAAEIRFTSPCIIALSGADFNATINNDLIPIHTTIKITKESILKFTKYTKGARCCLAVEGGWNISPWLNSHSTNMVAMVGGFEGRSLRRDDVINIKKIDITSNRSVSVNTEAFYRTDNTIRIIKGAEYDRLSELGKKLLETSLFKITIQSNRMGLKLQGASLSVVEDKAMISSAVTRGTIQLLPSGQLIVLMADHQTTGGYPRIANIITADFPTLAQMRPNDEVQFKLVTIEEAEEAYIDQQLLLKKTAEKIKSQFE